MRFTAQALPHFLKPLEVLANCSSPLETCTLVPIQSRTLQSVHRFGSPDYFSSGPRLFILLEQSNLRHGNLNEIRISVEINELKTYSLSDYTPRLIVSRHYQNTLPRYRLYLRSVVCDLSI